MSKPLRILFLCVANSARSQLAEGLAKSIFGESAIVESAGSVPSEVVQPMAVEVLKEVGIDISKNRPKSTDSLARSFLDNLDYVITLCAEEVCPTLPSSAKRLHWPIADPARDPEKREAFCNARESIREKLVGFMMDLAKEKAP